MWSGLQPRLSALKKSAARRSGLLIYPYCTIDSISSSPCILGAPFDEVRMGKQKGERVFMSEVHISFGSGKDADILAFFQCSLQGHPNSTGTAQGTRGQGKRGGVTCSTPRLDHLERRCPKAYLVTHGAKPSEETSHAYHNTSVAPFPRDQNLSVVTLSRCSWKVHLTVSEPI